MPMKCHYEILGVPRDSDGDQLKKSYRKLALKWHPDKNPDNLEECTKHFRLVQQAYEVLSDPQERAWYDKHREAILRGGLGQGDQYEDNCLNVFQYFNTGCFTGYGDDKEGFYCVYDEVFKTLAEEDRQFLDDEDDLLILDFGNTQSVFEEVVKPFYDYWENYCTAKSYVWKDKYDTRDAPDRRCRRLMEAENKKLRDSARQERNNEIRALTKYVKKRDKRVQEYKRKLEERAEEIKKKAEEQRQRHLEEGRKRLENYKEAEWSSASGLEGHYQELEAKYAAQFGDHSHEAGDTDEEAQEEEYYDDLYCVACDKMFKNEKSFKNHEKSKKHKDLVAIIKAHMEEEEAGQSEGGGTEAAVNQEEGEEEEEESNVSQKLSKKQKKKRKQQRNAALVEEVTDQLASTDLDPDVPQPAKKVKSKKELRREKKNKAMLDDDSDQDSTQPNTLNGDLNTDSDGDKPQVDTGEEKLTADVIDNVDDTSDNVTSEHLHSAENHISNNKLDQELDSEDDASGDTVNENVDCNGSEPSVASSDTHAVKAVKKKAKPQPDLNQKPGHCEICGDQFPSRSKLFDHIKATGHARLKQAPKSKGSSQEETSTKGKKNKKKGK